MTVFDKALGKVPTAALDISFEQLGERQVCRVDAPAASSPVYVRRKDNQLFFVRTGNSTRQFAIPDAIDYIGKRFR